MASGFGGTAAKLASQWALSITPGQQRTVRVLIENPKGGRSSVVTSRSPNIAPEVQCCAARAAVTFVAGGGGRHQIAIDAATERLIFGVIPIAAYWIRNSWRGR